ncbi:MAG: twin-arginine translocase TatA/TatE family subunit [Anaerolineales bacterium]|nr:twin-arginine translocase TatA/TatE family subunit [Anaerolineales bacterium]
MELLGIGPLELLLILVIALIIFSPKDLAKGGKMVGRWINRLYRSDAWKSMRQVSQEMQDLPARLAREAQLEELGDVEKDLNAKLNTPVSGGSAKHPKPPAAASKLPPAQQAESAAAAGQAPPAVGTAAGTPKPASPEASGAASPSPYGADPDVSKPQSAPASPIPPSPSASDSRGESANTPSPPPPSEKDPSD